jgi:UDP-glucose 4-epimerase
MTIKKMKKKRADGNGANTAGPSIVLTGAASFLGQNLLKILEADRRFPRVVAVDLYKPNFPLKKTRFYKFDLTQPTADAELAQILVNEQCDTFLHLALLSNPSHSSSYAHELEAIGSMFIVSACEEAKVRKLILGSTTMVYGATARNPNYLTEEMPLGGGKARFIRDKVEAEKEFAGFAKRNPQSVTTILRPAMILGPTIRNFWTHYFGRPVVPTIMGYDPLMQCVHETDVLDAYMKVIREDHPGAWNIVAPGVMPLSTILGISGKVQLPLPGPLFRPLAKGAWATGVMEMPPNMLDYLRFLWVADGEKAEKKMGFVPRHTTRETLQSFMGMQRLRAIHLVE